jgi:hypothetical protein
MGNRANFVIVKDQDWQPQPVCQIVGLGVDGVGRGLVRPYIFWPSATTVKPAGQPTAGNEGWIGYLCRAT